MVRSADHHRRDVMDGITRQGFAGQTVLGQIGLNHMNWRVEDAVIGTFLSPDPIFLTLTTCRTTIDIHTCTTIR